MSFTSPEFVLFFLAVLAGRAFARGPAGERWLLLAASLLFYACLGVYGLCVLLLIATVDYHVGRRMAAAPDRPRRRRWLLVSLASNLGALAFFKYAGFVAHNVEAALSSLGMHARPWQPSVLLPVGLSYFTFAGLSYAFDVYGRRLEPSRSWSEYLHYLAYFPKILAGPIMRAGDFFAQGRGVARTRAGDVEAGLAYILLGAVKKLVIADQIAGHVGLIFASPAQYNAATLLQGVLGYTVQVYCDFSGYSDMAIGVARLLGVRLPDNFAMPYSSVNISEFWRRWHISLSTWFRDYLFLPLAYRISNAVESERVWGVATVTWAYVAAMMATMLLCGLWHGASWNFVFWGGIHGAALAVHRAWSNRRRHRRRRGLRRLAWLRAVGSRALTLGVVMVAWVFFRADTWQLAWEYLGGLVAWRQGGLALGSPFIIPLTALVILAHLVINKDRNLIEELQARPVPIRGLAYGTLLLVLVLVSSSDSVPFVYLQF